MDSIRDISGIEIKGYDICESITTKEVMIVVKDRNGNLIVRNNIIGLSDFLDVYPDGELRILGNASISS